MCEKTIRKDATDWKNSVIRAQNLDTAALAKEVEKATERMTVGEDLAKALDVENPDWPRIFELFDRLQHLH